MFLLQGPVSAGSDLDFFDTHLKIHAGPPACSPHSAGNPDFAPPHWRASEPLLGSEQGTAVVLPCTLRRQWKEIKEILHEVLLVT